MKLGPEEEDLARGDLLLGKDSISRQHPAEFFKTYLTQSQRPGDSQISGLL